MLRFSFTRDLLKTRLWDRARMPSSPILLLERFKFWIWVFFKKFCKFLSTVAGYNVMPVFDTLKLLRLLALDSKVIRISKFLSDTLVLSILKKNGDFLLATTISPILMITLDLSEHLFSPIYSTYRFLHSWKTSNN